MFKSFFFSTTVVWLWAVESQIRARGFENPNVLRACGENYQIIGQGVRIEHDDSSSRWTESEAIHLDGGDPKLYTPVLIHDIENIIDHRSEKIGVSPLAMYYFALTRLQHTEATASSSSSPFLRVMCIEHSLFRTRMIVQRCKESLSSVAREPNFTKALQTLNNAISIMRKHDLVHLNLNPDTLCYDDADQHLKVSLVDGFNTWRIVLNDMTSHWEPMVSSFNRSFLPPEVQENSKTCVFQSNADVYSAGAILQYILNRRDKNAKKVPESWHSIVHRSMAHNYLERLTSDDFLMEAQTILANEEED